MAVIVPVLWPATDWLRPRMWALRHNLTGYDATYVALAEITDATALLTTDAGLAQAPVVISSCCDRPLGMDSGVRWPIRYWEPS